MCPHYSGSCLYKTKFCTILHSVQLYYYMNNTLLYETNLFSKNITYVLSAINSNLYLLETCIHLESITYYILFRLVNII